jgi:hypothetical protein
MKNFLIMVFLLMAIVLISLCAGIPNFPDIPFLNEPVQSTSGIEISNEDISVNVKSLPSEVSGGSDVILYFQITNKANYDLEDVSLNLYDPCVFNNGNSKEESIGELKSNRTDTTSWTLTSEVITLTRDCEMKFAVSYKGKSTFYQDVVVLAQSEYNTRLLQGTLHSIPIKSSFSSSPLQISSTFNEEQPLLDGSSVDVQINYAYTGSGFIDVGAGDVVIDLPSNLEVSGAGCRGDYDSSLSLAEPLKFINKRASPSTCTFKATTSQLIDIGLLTIAADYKYTLDSSIPVRVKGTSTSNPQPYVE